MEAPAPLIDIGVNLTNKAFRDDRDAVLERAWAAGLEALVVIGTDVAHSREAVALAAAHPGRLYATVGVHPHDAESWDDACAATLAALARRPGVAALGECGLDFNRNYSPRSDQLRAFEAQLELAADLALPVYLHQRDARDAFLALVSRYRDRLPRAVAHCFTGDRETVAAYRDLDLHFGVTGWICDERRGDALREAVGEIPLERLMLETDAPFLLPRDLRPPPRSRRNEPALLPHVCAAVAAARGCAAGEVGAATTATARACFGIGETPQ